MKNGQSDWRSLDKPTKFGYLLNYFIDAATFSQASGLTVKQIRSVFSVLQQGKKSRILEGSDFALAIRRARKRMTDSMGRVRRQAQDAKYEAPVLKVGQTLLTPMRYQVYLERAHKVVESFWISYHVEHLPEEQIFQIARELFHLYMQTGQFNTFRFEYIAEASVYLENSVPSGGKHKRRTFKDEGLRIQANQHDVIKISSHSMGFPEFEGDVDLFEDRFREVWAEKKVKGGIRLTDLAFTKFDSVENVMDEVRKDYRKHKNVNRTNTSGNKKRKRGEGGGFA